jgi:hypothetical protein
MPLLPLPFEQILKLAAWHWVGAQVVLAGLLRVHLAPVLAGSSALGSGTNLQTQQEEMQKHHASPNAHATVWSMRGCRARLKHRLLPRNTRNALLKQDMMYSNGFQDV